uniref:EF-hand domain-containing protein n=1 Tax=viral metagenome TaxID=1070528 RepID=A0A6C0DAQ6_9ZZZZ
MAEVTELNKSLQVVCNLSHDLRNDFASLNKLCITIRKNNDKKIFTDFDDLFLQVKQVVLLIRDYIIIVKNEVIILKDKLNNVLAGKNYLKDKISSSFSGLIGEIKLFIDIIEEKLFRKNNICIFSSGYDLWTNKDFSHNDCAFCSNCLNIKYQLPVLNPIDILIEAIYVVSHQLAIASETLFCITKAACLRFIMMHNDYDNYLQDFDILISDKELLVTKFYDCQDLSKNRKLTRKEFDEEMGLLALHF